MMIKKILTALAILLVLGAFFYIFAGRIAVYTLGAVYNIDISYQKYRWPLSFSGLKAIDKKSGMGLAAEDALFFPRFDKGFMLGFDLSAVRFIKKDPGAQPASYDTLTSLVEAPFSNQWVYEKVSGDIVPYGGGVEVRRLYATGDNIRLSFKGTIGGDDALSSDITIYFSDKLVSGIPNEVTRALLSDERDGWKSISVKLEGNLRTPSIQLSGSRFRLNIRTLTQ